MSKLKTKKIKGYEFIEYKKETYSSEEARVRSKVFFEFMDQRRTVRDFSDKPLPDELVENLVKTASTAPSGAHKQPWTFCIVSNPEIKKEIRIAAEKEEYESYHNRMPDEWLKALAPLQTDWKKPFLEIAPILIVVFKKAYDLDREGNISTNYYVNESVGLACGFLLAAIHNAGLVALTHTPSPMKFLSEILERPKNEKPFLLIPIGYPAEETYVPKLERKKLDEIASFYN